MRRTESGSHRKWDAKIKGRELRKANAIVPKALYLNLPTIAPYIFVTLLSVLSFLSSFLKYYSFDQQKISSVK